MCLHDFLLFCPLCLAFSFDIDTCKLLPCSGILGVFLNLFLVQLDTGRPAVTTTPCGASSAIKLTSLSGEQLIALGKVFLVLNYSIYSKQPILGLTQEWFRELSFSRLECGVHDKLHIYPLCGIFYFPWHRHQIEGTNGFYCLIRKTQAVWG